MGTKEIARYIFLPFIISFRFSELAHTLERIEAIRQGGNILTTNLDLIHVLQILSNDLKNLLIRNGLDQALGQQVLSFTRSNNAYFEEIRPQLANVARAPNEIILFIKYLNCIRTLHNMLGSRPSSYREFHDHLIRTFEAAAADIDQIYRNYLSI